MEVDVFGQVNYSIFQNAAVNNYVSQSDLIRELTSMQKKMKLEGSSAKCLQQRNYKRLTFELVHDKISRKCSISMAYYRAQTYVWRESLSKSLFSIINKKIHSNNFKNCYRACAIWTLSILLSRVAPLPKFDSLLVLSTLWNM